MNAPVNAIPNAMSIGVRRFEDLALIHTQPPHLQILSWKPEPGKQGSWLPGGSEGTSQNRSLLAMNVPWAACEKLALEEFLGWTLGARPRSEATTQKALLVDPADL